MNTSIAKYEERRFDGRRLFELFSDHLQVSGVASLGPRFEQFVDLTALNAMPDRLWTRPAGFWGGIGMVITCSVIPMGFESAISLWWKGLFWVLCAGGALLALATFRRIEWAVFRNLSGVQIVTIARAGPNRDQFEAFVNAMRQGIANCSERGNDGRTDT